MNSSNANSANANANTNANTNNANIIATANGELVNASNGNVIVSNNSGNLAMNGDLEEEIMKKMKYPAIVIFSIMFVASVVLLIFMFLEEEPVSRLELVKRIFYATASGVGVVIYSVLV